MEEPADERRQLYDRFRSELATSPRDMFFDEKELVEIYDQAGDLDDEHVKLEVLLHGFRLYPDSEDLAMRRAYFYYNYHLDDGVRDMWKNRVAQRSVVEYPENKDDSRGRRPRGTGQADRLHR